MLRSDCCAHVTRSKMTSSVLRHVQARRGETRPAWRPGAQIPLFKKLSVSFTRLSSSLKHLCVLGTTGSGTQCSPPRLAATVLWLPALLAYWRRDALEGALRRLAVAGKADPSGIRDDGARVAPAHPSHLDAPSALVSGEPGDAQFAPGAERFEPTGDLGGRPQPHARTPGQHGRQLPAVSKMTAHGPEE